MSSVPEVALVAVLVVEVVEVGCGGGGVLKGTLADRLGGRGSGGFAFEHGRGNKGRRPYHCGGR